MFAEEANCYCKKVAVRFPSFLQTTNLITIFIFRIMCKIQIPEGATLDEKRTLCFDALYNMKLGEMVEKKDNLSYLSWSNAWKAFKEVYPSATFRVICNPDTKLPYFVDPNVGIIVFTEVFLDICLLRTGNLGAYTIKKPDITLPLERELFAELTHEVAKADNLFFGFLQALVKDMSSSGKARRIDRLAAKESSDTTIGCLGVAILLLLLNTGLLIAILCIVV